MTGTELFSGFDVLLDDSLPPGCIKFVHGDGRADVFLIDGESAVRMVVNPIGRIFHPDSPGGRLWLESARQKQAKEEAAKAETTLDYFGAIVRASWFDPGLALELYGKALDFGPQDLDEWLAEDNPHRLSPYGVPGPLEALGLA